MPTSCWRCRHRYQPTDSSGSLCGVNDLMYVSRETFNTQLIYITVCFIWWRLHSSGNLYSIHLTVAELEAAQLVNTGCMHVRSNMTRDMDTFAAQPLNDALVCIHTLCIRWCGVDMCLYVVVITSRHIGDHKLNSETNRKLLLQNGSRIWPCIRSVKCGFIRFISSLISPLHFFVLIAWKSFDIGTAYIRIWKVYLTALFPDRGADGFEFVRVACRHVSAVSQAKLHRLHDWADRYWPNSYSFCIVKSQTVNLTSLNVKHPINVR
jgi:hypothetical protein